jgi:predicted phosphodiesterase
MKTLVFSDTHLTNRFEEQKYEFLTKIISTHDHVIINGDFWDSWLTNFDSFIKSKWNKIFTLLREKNTIYIHGDHDPSERCDQRTSYFASQSVHSHIYKSPQKQFYLEHGHHFMKNKREKYIELFFKLQNFILKSHLSKPWCQFIDSLESIAHTALSPRAFSESPIAKNLNKLMKKYKHKDLLWICGDSHYPEIDLSSNYANSGCIRYSYASYLTISKGSLSLCKTTY